MSVDLEAFQQLLRGMRLGFLDELAERCDGFEELILALEKSRGARDTFDELYRGIHSVKGSGGTHGLAIISALCHQLENLLTDAALQGNFGAEFTNRTLAHVDLLRRIIPLARQSDPDFAPIERELDTLRQTFLQQSKAGLIAESSSMMARIYQAALASEHVKLTVVDNGLEALERLVHERYDFAIIGRELKELNGIAVLSALRTSLGRNQALPVLLVTSNRDNIPDHLKVSTVLPRDQKLSAALPGAVQALLK